MNRYEEILARIFKAKYRKGQARIRVERTDFDKAADGLKIDRIKNLGDIVYSVRYRTELPDEIQATAQANCEWIILGAGKGAYEFRLARKAKVVAADPDTREQIKILDSTPEVLALYAPSKDEQALLTRVRYNRIIDIFLGLTCYSIQNHFRTTVDNIGQIEVDEIYIGFNKQGAHFVIPCQAKSPGDKFGIVQVYQDIALCAAQYGNAIARPVGLQFTGAHSLAVLELSVREENEILSLKVVDEKHYLFVKSNGINDAEIAKYSKR